MIAPLAAEKRGFLKKRRSSIGLDDLSSHTRNAPTSAKPAANPTRICGDVHPWLGASMIAHRTAPSPRIDSAAPPGSSLGVVLSLESGTNG